MNLPIRNTYQGFSQSWQNSMLIKTKLGRIGLFVIIGLMVTTALTDILANLFGGKGIAVLVGNLMYVPLTILLATLSSIQAFRFGRNNTIGIATILFAIFATLWMIAEHIWIIKEVILHEKPFPSIANFFYIFGYPFLILASFRYLRIVKNAITKKMIIVASLLSIVLVIPSIYIATGSDSDKQFLGLGTEALYSILDGLALIPAIIGFSLFLGGEVFFPWLLFSLAIFTIACGDTAFLIVDRYGWYYTGHPIEILFYWSYILFSYAVYSHLIIFKTQKKKFDNKESMR